MSGARTWERAAWPLAGAAALLLAWTLGVFWSHTNVFPSPAHVLRGLGELARTHVLWADIADSLRRVLEGFGLAALLGVPLGCLLGSSPLLFAALNPLLQVLRPISPLAWIPIAILVLGIGDRAATSLIFLAALLPITVSTTAAVAEVPEVYRRVAANFFGGGRSGVGGRWAALRVALPAALPGVLIGLRIALGVAWLVVVAAEMVAVDSGLGYLVIDSRNAGKRYDLVLAAMLVIGVLGLLLDRLFRLVERVPALRWGFREDA